MQDRGLERAGGGCKAGGKVENPPPKASFLSSLTRQLFHGIHKIHLSREAPGGNRGEREEERERGRECEGHRGAKVQQHKKINSKDRTLILHSGLKPCSERGGRGCSPPAHRDSLA